jgi:hypothetical protein
MIKVMLDKLDSGLTELMYCCLFVTLQIHIHLFEIVLCMLVAYHK